MAAKQGASSAQVQRGGLKRRGELINQLRGGLTNKNAATQTSLKLSTYRSCGKLKLWKVRGPVYSKQEKALLKAGFP